MGAVTSSQKPHFTDGNTDYLRNTKNDKFSGLSGILELSVIHGQFNPIKLIKLPFFPKCLSY